MPSPSQPPPSAAERRAEVTRDVIRDALGAILVEEHPASVSMPAVAERAGMSVRTLYRYFPNKQALLDDYSGRYLRRANELLAGGPDLFGDAQSYLRVLWTDFATDVEAVRAQHNSPAGQELRARRLDQNRTRLAKLVDDTHPTTSQADRDRLVDLAIALTGSGMFLELVGRLGQSPTEAADLVWWAVNALQKQFAEDGEIP